MAFLRRWFLGGAAAAPAVWGAGTARPGASAFEKSLLKALEELRLFNVHEHLIPERERVAQPVDFFTLAGHYALNDVISAGLEGGALALVRNRDAPLEQRWKAFEPYWEAARFTGYSQALRIAMADIYGAGEISAASISRINDAIARANKPGLYDFVLKERARIEWNLVDPYWSSKPERMERPDFLLSQRFDRFITPASRADLDALEKIAGVAIDSLAGLKRALEATFEQGLGAGMVAVKSGLAYSRELFFDQTPESGAAEDFAALLKGGETKRQYRRLEDHMFHHLARLAAEHGVPFQIHTGLLAGNSRPFENTRPTHLANLFQLYPRVKFDLFHIGYPYQQELAALAKLFPNVYADFCWAHIISPVGSRRALDEYLETMPLNKILGFGGDYRYPELSYAHARMARANVAQVLAAKVEAGLFTETQALDAGRLLLRENALRLFGARRLEPERASTGYLKRSRGTHHR